MASVAIRNVGAYLLAHAGGRQRRTERNIEPRLRIWVELLMRNDLVRMP
jgi:hypothetical protein